MIAITQTNLATVLIISENPNSCSVFFEMSRKDVFSQAAKVYFTAANVSKFVPNSNVKVSNTMKEYLMSELTVFDSSKAADKNFFRSIVTATRHSSELSDHKQF